MSVHAIQTFGGPLESDGRLTGNLDVQTVQCPNQVCSIKVPAPAVAVVFFTTTALNAVQPASTATFATTTITQLGARIVVDPTVLATSNGHSGMENFRMATSQRSASSAAGLRESVPGIMALLAVVCGAWFVRQHM